jgi:hypothetical protein
MGTNKALRRIAGGAAQFITSRPCMLSHEAPARSALYSAYDRWLRNNEVAQRLCGFCLLPRNAHFASVGLHHCELAT